MSFFIIEYFLIWQPQKRFEFYAFIYESKSEKLVSKVTINTVERIMYAVQSVDTHVGVGTKIAIVSNDHIFVHF